MSFRPIALLTLLACSTPQDKPPAPPAPPTPAGPTAADAKAWMEGVEGRLRELWVADSRAQWAYATDITDEHEKAVEAATAATMEYTTRTIKESAKYASIEGLDDDTRRKIHLLQVSATAPGPDDPAKRTELAGILAEMEGAYGKGKYCEKETCKPEELRDLGYAEDVLANNRDWDAQLTAWKGWHSVAVPLKDKYKRFVELSNEGSKEIGYADTGALWRSGYDMPPEALQGEVERLWTQVKPLYDALHCHVRAKLVEKYGKDKVPATGRIPAHVLGNMWAQDWSNLYPMLEPYPKEPDLDVTKALVAKGYDWKKMVTTAEGFFTSLGMDPLPPTFWDRSMFLKPEGKEVVCHASAWDVEINDDLRIKMCIKVNYDDFTTLHHELGHDYYYHYYHTLPILYQSGANDGFHEGIGDTLALSITPGYLNQLGLLDKVSESQESVINKQMQDALAKIAFLPFGYLIDKWRWGVFDGHAPPDAWTAEWWRLRGVYQGIDAPIPRTEADFDPGAKYHIPANTPYMRYFLAHILQYQFHEALCKAAGHTGPLYTCSIYGNKAAGDKMKTMLAMGASKPWPEALEAISGSSQMDASAIIRYFDPLMTWLQEQNKDRQYGW
ncbi:MAG TPA: M2 family metallopeptidase [Myxococcota bacterium]|nr:M2 family metallopeptidase [Myxococcota bacterium]